MALGQYWETSVTGTTNGLNSIAQNGDTVVAVGKNKTILRSIDRGKNWTSISAPSTVDDTEEILEVKSNGTTFVAITMTKILRSTNSGATWTHVATIPVSGSYYTSLGNTGSIFVIGTRGGNGVIYKSTNNGSSFSSVATAGAPVIEHRLIATYGTHVFIATTNMIYRSTNGGINYELVFNGSGSNYQFNGVYNNGSIFFFAGFLMSGTTRIGRIVRWDSTANTYVNRELGNGFIWGISGNGSTIIAGKDSNKAFISTDDGLNWTAVTTSSATIPRDYVLTKQAGSLYIVSCHDSGKIERSEEALSIFIDPNNIDTSTNKTHEVKATIMPATATNTDITVTSTNGSLLTASPSKAGNVTTYTIETKNEPGKTTLVFRTVDGGFVGTTTINIIISTKYLFQDGEEIKTYISDKNAVPIMTGPTTPSGTASASSEYTTSGYEAWRAFNGLTGSGNYWRAANMQATGWLSYAFEAGRVINKYSLVSPTSTAAVGMPKDWTFEGSNDDGATWTVLDTRAGIIFGSEVQYFEFENNTAYKVYRINVTLSGNGTYLSIGEMELFGEAGLQSIGAAPATKELFDIHGMTDLSIIDNEIIQQLTSPTPELLCWTDEEKANPQTSIPAMTSNTAPSGIADQSDYYADRPAYCAFDKTVNSWITPQGVLTGWISYEFPQPTVIEKYTLLCQTFSTVGVGPERAPKDWTFEAWDGVQWVVLDTQVGIADWQEEVVKEFEINNHTAYQKYRINVTANNGSPSYVVIREMDMFGDYVYPERTSNLTAIPHPQLLLPVGDIEVGELESVEVEAQIKGGYSPTSIIPVMTSNTTPAPFVASASSSSSATYQPWKAFNDNSSDHTDIWFSSTSLPAWLKIDLGEARKIGKYEITNYPSSLGNLGFDPKDWTFEGSNDDANWTKLHEVNNSPQMNYGEKRAYEFNNSTSYRYYRIVASSTVAGFIKVAIGELKLYESISGDSDIKVLVSVDSGASWQGKSPVNPASLEEVKANGFATGEFNALTKEELASLFLNGKARFAFYLEQEKSTDIVQVNSLSINEMQYTITPSVEGLSAIYEMLKTDDPTFYVSRNDGVDWQEVQPDQLMNLSQLEGNQLRVKAVLSNGQELHALSYSWN